MKKWSKIIFICIMLLLIYMPILILAVYSFTTSANIGSIHGWSLHNYVTLFTKDELRSMIVGTVFLAAGSALIATILGTLGAIGAFYSKKWASASINAMNEVPVVNADVVTGFSICILLIVAFGMSKDSDVPLVTFAKICAAQQVLRELPFITALPAGAVLAAQGHEALPTAADVQVLVQGIADLVLVYPDHLELLDYKTDRRKAESDFLRAYRAQLNLYAIAIEKRFAPKKVTYKGIYSFALGKLIEA